MLIQELYNEKPGYDPFLITEQWQVAQLNYSKEQNPFEIRELEIHYHTDETFTLLKGKAFLIAAEDDKLEELQMVWLEIGKTYNIPKGIWHNIAMFEGSEILITENANTHKEKKNLYALPLLAQKKIQEFNLIAAKQL